MFESRLISRILLPRIGRMSAEVARHQSHGTEHATQLDRPRPRTTDAIHLPKPLDTDSTQQLTRLPLVASPHELARTRKM